MQLIKLLPDYYADNKTMVLLQSILSGQTEYLEGRLDQTVSDCFVSTAVDTLTRLEQIMGIIPDVSKSNRYRRERIMAKIAGAGTTTASLIQSIAESYTNAEVELTEDFPRYTVTVRFTGTSGIPGNMDDIKASIEEAIPAHLQILYEYILTHMDLLARLPMRSLRPIPIINQEWASKEPDPGTAEIPA